jgi:uncharacterized integral membrane protein (TIGR00698 family)
MNLAMTNARQPSMSLPERLATFRDGVAVAVVIGIGANFLSSTFHLSAMLFALLLGILLNFLRDDERCKAGIQFASTVLLRIGIALLGLRITVSQIASLGWITVAIVIVGIAFTIVIGVIAARRLRLGDHFGVLSGGAVSICGASAALAISSVLPKDDQSERDASFVVITVTALSTVAMVAYPILSRAFGLDDRAAGIFFGGTIHDVAQVVGAGYSVSQQAGDVATIVKLLRVAMLLPVCVVVGVVLRSRGTSSARKVSVLPWFVVAFAILVVAGSSGWLPQPVFAWSNSASSWLLVTAMAAIGMKTSFRSLAAVGPKAIFLVVVETLFLCALILGVIAWLSASASS